MKLPLLAVGLGALAALSQSGTALGQQTNVERFERQLEQIQREQRLAVDLDVPAGQRIRFDYGGYLGFNFFAVDDIEQNTHILRQYDLVGYARLNIDNVHEFFLRARTGYQDFNSGDSFDGEGDETISPTVEQAFYRFDLARYLSGYKGTVTNNNLVLQGGRQFVFWANGLVLGETLDGGLAEITWGNLNLELLGGVTARDTVDFDSSRPDFDHDTRRAFYGGRLSARLGKHRPFVYGLVQRDHNEDEVLSIGGTTTRFEYDSYYIGAGCGGSFGDRLVYALEVAYQGGSALSNSFDPDTLAPIRQTDEEISAAAMDLRLDYLLADERRSRLTFEMILATGDDDRIHSSNTFGGNRPGTDDRAFNAWGLLNAGLAFSPNVSNLMTARLGASTFPFTGGGTLGRIQVGADLIFFGKFDEDAPIDETTSDDRFLGWEPDFYLNWQITSDVTLAVRYGVFFPGDAIVADEHPRHFFFTGVTFAF